MKQFKYIGNMTEVELQKSCVHAFVNENGFRCILIKNEIPKTVLVKYDTDNLEIKLNSLLVLNDNKYYFHIITSKQNTYNANLNFEIVYDYIFRKINEPITDDDLSKLVLSLEDYFRVSPERDTRKLQIGIWGELFCVRTLYENGYKEILEKYHHNFLLKHDVEISNKLRIEIKTSINSKRVHHFSHDQICRQDVKVLVASLILEESQEGLALWDLFSELLSLCTDPDERLDLYKIVKRCNVTEENKGIRVSEKKAILDMKFFQASDLPMITYAIPKGITSLEYDVDCALSSQILIDDIIAYCKLEKE